MKNKFALSLIVTLVCLCAVGALAACGGGGENAPKDVLIAPNGIDYDAETGRITWSISGPADIYYISINGEEETAVSTLYYPYTSFAEFTVSIRAGRRDGLYQDSEAAQITFVPLDPVGAVSVDNSGRLFWQTVAGANGYIVDVSGEQISVGSAEYTALPVGMAKYVRVKPVVVGASAGLRYYSKWSDTVSVNILNAVRRDSVQYEDGVLTWNEVADAAGYELNINGGTVETVETNRFPYNAENKSFTVTVKAIGDHTATYDSAEMNAKRFVYLRPVTNIYVKDGDLGWERVEGATSYMINDHNVPLATVTETTYTKLVANTPYAITILPVADEDDSCYFSSWSAIQNINILPAPSVSWQSGVALDGQEAEVVTWDPVNNASGYWYKIVTPGGGQPLSKQTSGVSYRSAFLEMGTYTVQIKSAAAVGSGYYDSKYSPAIYVVRLAAPVVKAGNITSTNNDLSNGFQVSFDAVNGATAYDIYKNGVNMSARSTGTSFHITDIVDGDAAAGANVGYFIRSIGSGIRQTSNMGERTVVLDSLTGDQYTASSAFRITVLPTPSIAAEPISGSTYSFGSVSGSNGYSVNVSGSCSTVNSPSYDLRGLSAGTFTVRACALGNGSNVLPSNYTTPVTVIRLSAPDNVRISTDDASDGVLAFDPVPGAVSYDAIFTNGESVSITDNHFPNLKSRITTAGTTLNVKSVADVWIRGIYYMSSADGPTKTFYKLSAPRNLTFTNTQLVWNAPQNVDTSIVSPMYRIYDGADATAYNGFSTSTSYDISDLDGGKEYTFYIVAVGDGARYINSDRMEGAFRKIYKLDRPALNVNAETGNYEWYGVSGASAYVVEINGVIVENKNHVGTDLYTYKPSFSEVKDYEVKLYAVGDGGNSTVNSKPFEFTQRTALLTTPAFSYSYNSDYYIPNGQITVKITTSSEHAEGYCYSIGGADYRANAETFTVQTSAVSSLAIYVYAFGGSFDDEEIYYIDSLHAETKTLNILTTPDASSMDLSKDGVLSWAYIMGALQYHVTLDIFGTDGKHYTAELDTGNNTPSVDLSKPFAVTADDGTQSTIRYSDIRTMKVTVRAIGTVKANTDIISTNATVSSGVQTKSWDSALH